LFVVEPVAAKQLLPAFGGSAAVWITCLVFFQMALLCAYLYAHWLARTSRWSSYLALMLLAAVSAGYWAIHPPNLKSPSGHPIAAIFGALGIAIGFPFLALGSTSPLLQAWLARIEKGAIPYRLFALSNLASLLALGLYPTLIEPYFTLRTQRLAWLTGFLIFAGISILLAMKTRSAPAYVAESESATVLEAAPPTPWKRKLFWILLPMAAAMQLSAVTSYLTANIAAIPLLWILPLATYLITMIVAFQFPKLAPRWLVTRLLVVMLASLGYMMSQVDVSLPIRIGIIFFLIELFLACLFCHTEAYRLRPERPSESTLFYLFFAAGGALGSFLIGIAAPMLFSFNYDLAISFFVVAALAACVTWNTGWGPRLLWSAATVLMFVLIIFLHIAYQRDTPVAVRNFYGSLRVHQSIRYPGFLVRSLTNGNIQHGIQIFSNDLRKTPTTYYAPDSGVGLAMHWCCPGRARNIGVVGLGAGTLAAYGEPGDRIRFYEINPAVVPVAQNLFTYMRESGAKIDIVEGDARNSLADEQPQNFDVLVIDAFSGDAIPLHLLTTQAVDIYKRNLAPGGILAFHISNQHVDLEPEVAQLAKEAGMKAMRFTSLAREDRGEFSATWVLLSQSPTFFDIPQVAAAGRQPAADARIRAWTDDYSSLWPTMRW
jgi:SAM-dependent methyltransferase